MRNLEGIKGRLELKVNKIELERQKLKTQIEDHSLDLKEMEGEVALSKKLTEEVKRKLLASKFEIKSIKEQSGLIQQESLELKSQFKLTEVGRARLEQENEDLRGSNQRLKAAIDESR